MKTTALIALLALAALAPRSAAADDLAVNMTLDTGRNHASVFILEAEALFGADLEGIVLWKVNGLPINESSANRVDGRLFEVRALALSEASLVCAEFIGRLSLGGDLGRDIEEQACAVWLPWDGPLESVSGDSRLLQDRVRPLPEPIQRPIRRR